MATENTGSSSRKGTTKHCCWGNCANDTTYPERLPAGTSFLPFPKPGKINESMTPWEKNKQNIKTEKAKRWAHACGRKDFGIQNIKGHTYICTNHFVNNSGPTEENPDPFSATLTASEVQKKLAKKRKEQTPRQPIPKKKYSNKTIKENTSNTNQPDFTDMDLVEPEPEPRTRDASTQTEPISISTTETQTAVIQTSTVSTETEPDKLAVASRIQNLVLKNELTLIKSKQQMESHSPVQLTNPMDINNILKSEKKCIYFIGLSPNHFWRLYEFLGEAKFNLTYWNSKKESTTRTRISSLTLPEQLFITLLRLRRGFNIFTLAHFYGVSETTIRTIFTTWMMFLFRHFKSFEIFPERQAFRKFYQKFFDHSKTLEPALIVLNLNARHHVTISNRDICTQTTKVIVP